MNTYAAYHVMRGGMDPFGLKAVKGNKYGDWEITQKNTDGAKERRWRYSSKVHIIFKPNEKTVCCKHISFIQTAKISRASTGKPDDGTVQERMARFTNDKTAVDRFPKYKEPWYAIDNDGFYDPTLGKRGAAGPGILYSTAELHDTPSWNQPDLKWEFETVAICKSGDDENVVYGSLKWGFTADKMNKLTSEKTVSHNTPSNTFYDAVEQWNVQTANEAGNLVKNHQEQVPIPPLTSPAEGFQP